MKKSERTPEGELLSRLLQKKFELTNVGVDAMGIKHTTYYNTVTRMTVKEWEEYGYDEAIKKALGDDNWKKLEKVSSKNTSNQLNEPNEAYGVQSKLFNKLDDIQKDINNLNSRMKIISDSLPAIINLMQKS